MCAGTKLLKSTEATNLRNVHIMMVRSLQGEGFYTVLTVRQSHDKTKTKAVVDCLSLNTLQPLNMSHFFQANSFPLKMKVFKNRSEIYSFMFFVKGLVSS